MASEAGGPSQASLADRYRVLLDVGRTLTGTLGREELYEAIYDQTRRVLETDGFFISLYDARRDEARIVFYVDRAEIRRTDVVYRGTDSAALRTGEATFEDDRRQAKSLMLLGVDESQVTRSGMSAPLRWKGNVLGAVSVQSYRPSAFDRDDLELLQGIADLAAVAIENAHQVAELHRKRREAEQVEQIGRALASSLDPQEVLLKIIDAVLDLVDHAQGASVWLLEPGLIARVAASGGSPALPVGLECRLQGSPFADVADENRSVTLDDLRSGPVLPPEFRDHVSGGSGVAVPLSVNGEVAGILFCDSPEDRPMGTDQVGILQRLAGQASVALGNARLHASLQSLTLTDPLTGLGNRRHLRLHLEREVAAARRGRALHAVLFDLDRFKEYNDTFGHVAGDKALKAFADVLHRQNRAMNLVARYGGDEFVSILTDSTDGGARLYVERVLEDVAADPTLSGGRVSVTWGVSGFDRDRMKTADDLIEEADVDFYRRKEEQNGGGSNAR
jgi:diguanylate cyclase (GGDEF)-like protein